MHDTKAQHNKFQLKHKKECTTQWNNPYQTCDTGTIE